MRVVMRVDGHGARFTPEAARGLIGKTVPVNYRATDAGPVLSQLGSGTVINADLADGGAAVTLTVEITPT